MRIAPTAALCAFLAACTPQATPTADRVCPRPTEWSAADVAAFAAAEHELDLASPIWQELEELDKLRKESRACAGAVR